MASIKLSRNDIETLEVKANLAYETFRRAFFTRDDTERAALFSSAACLYAYDLEDYLSSLTQRNTENIRCLGKGGRLVSYCWLWIM